MRLLPRVHHFRFRSLAIVTSAAFAHLIFLPTCSSLTEAAEQRIRYFHPDHLGSTNLVTDETGNIIERTTYKPFGEVHQREIRNPNTGQLIVADQASLVSPYGYTGQRQDTSTGLYFYNARYYDPQLGRFIQPDSFVQAPADPQLLNRYSYVRNNPIKYTDPSGHFLNFLIGVIVAIAISVTVELAINAFNISGSGAKALRFAGAIVSGGLGGSIGGLTGQALTNAIGAAGATSLTLNAGEGRQLTKSVSKKFEQMGLSPKAAAIAGAALTSTVVSTGYGVAFSSLTAPAGITKQQIQGDQWTSDPRYAELHAGEGASEGFWGRGSNITDTLKSPNARLVEFSKNGRVMGILATAPLFGDVPVLGHLAHFLQINHSAFVGYKSTGGIVSSMMPISKIEYATTTVCHTCTLIAGTNSGAPVASLLMAIGPSGALSSMLYGLHGGATTTAAATAAVQDLE